MASQKTFSVLENLVRMTELLHTPVISKERVKRSSNFQCYTYVQSGWPNKIQDQSKPFHSCKNELSVGNSCLIWESHIIIQAYH